MLMVTHPAIDAARARGITDDASRMLGALLLHDGFHVVLRHALQPLDQLAPVDRTIVADDRNRRNSTSLNDHVALRCTFDAVHFAHPVLQPAREPQPLITELVEKA